MSSKKLSKEQRLELEKEQRWESAKLEAEYYGWKETLRKEKVQKKFNRKRERLEKRYALSPEEKDALYKSGSMKLMGTAKSALFRAYRKQKKYKKKNAKYKKKRFLKLQDKKTRQRLKKRDKERKRKEKQR